MYHNNGIDPPSDRLRWAPRWAGVVVKLAGTRLAPALISLLLASLLGTAAAQSPEKAPKVGYISSGSSDPVGLRRFEAFRQGLRELGYVERQSIVLEPRWAETEYDRIPALAADLVRLKVDVIVTGGGLETRVVQQATRTIPIVMSVVNDPVGSGLVASLARPGGNVTGLTIMGPDLAGKQLQLLKEVVPKLSRVALLTNPENPASARFLREVETAARALGLQLQTLEARNSREIDSAFSAMTGERAGALLILPEGVFLTQRSQIAKLAATRRLPSIYGTPEYAEAGGLMAYSANRLDNMRRAATFVDKILKGAKPADLPVEQPAKFELAINLRTAKAIGLTVPPSLLQRADQIID